MKYSFPDFFKGSTPRGISIAVVAILCIMVVSAGLRYIQLERWRDHREHYFVDKMPQTTTLDSYKWLRYADEYKKGEYYPSDKDELMFYPDDKAKHKDIPMLSWLIAKLSIFSDGNIYRTAIYLTPFLASLFVIPLGLYFYFIGILPAGIAGGIAGSLSIVYLVRTAIGRVDTDALNLFFPLLSSLFILLASEQKNNTKTYVHSALAGLSMWLFYWWYEHPGISLAYLAILIFSLLISKKGLKVLAISVMLFIIFANPWQFKEGLVHLLGFINVYLKPTGVISAGFPDIYATISEVRRSSFNEVLSFLTPFKLLSATGLILFVICGIFNFRKLVPLAPVFALGLLVFISSNRFAMFLAPFVGAGLGYGLYLLSQFFITESEKSFKIKQGAFVVVTAVFMLSSYNSSFDYNPVPSIEVGVYKQIKELKKVTPKDSVIYSWWDYGLAYEFAGFKTFHDGMTQRSPKTYFIAKSFTSPDQHDLYNTVAFLADKGKKGVDALINEGLSPYQIIEQVENNDLPVTKNKYIILYTRDMLLKLGSISQISTWDFNTENFDPFFLRQMRCTTKEGNTLICGQDSINLATGLLNNVYPIKSHTVTIDGKIFNSREFAYQNGFHFIESRWDSGYTDFLIMDDRAYRSNMVQMFVIGNADSELFTEVFNSIPYARAFLVNVR